MQCEGYRQGSHEVEKLHTKHPPLCQLCYMRQYRSIHYVELQEYQADYRTGQVYKELNRSYQRRHRGKAICAREDV